MDNDMLNKLKNSSRLLVEASLAPIQGERFQPTNFPDQQAALYKAPRRNRDGKPDVDSNGIPIYEDVLLVESAQSMANRMERVCWKDEADGSNRVGDYNEDCRGIPYVLAMDMNGQKLTASTLEAHRLASPYIWKTRPVKNLDRPLPDFLKIKFELQENRLVPWKKVANTLLMVDPGCLLHGIWFSDKDFSGGKVRLTRTLTGFIEARNPQPVNYGFQKRDPVSDRTDRDAGQTAEFGFGSVIGPMQDFTSDDIRAYFQLDVERLHSYGLPDDMFEALLAWGLYKIRKVLSTGRDSIGDLRTRCKYKIIGDPKATLLDLDGTQMDWTLPNIDEIVKCLSALKLENGPIQVKWIPEIEGKADLTDASMDESDLLRFNGKVEIKEENKSKKDKTKVRYLVISGEFTQNDEKLLRELFLGKEKALSVINKAVENYRKKYEQKMSGAKPANEEQEQ